MPLLFEPFCEAQRSWHSVRGYDTAFLIEQYEWDWMSKCPAEITPLGLFEIETFIPQSVPDVGLGLGFNALGIEEDYRNYLKPARRALRLVKPREVRRLDMPGTRPIYRRSDARTP